MANYTDSDLKQSTPAPALGESHHPIQDQPTSTPSMVASSAPLRTRGAYGSRAGSHSGGTSQGDFSTGLCGCSAGPFCYSFWCPCLSYGDNKQRLAALSATGQPIHKDGIEAMGSDSVLFCALNCCTGLGCLLDYVQRGNVRNRYEIGGGAIKDLVVSWCCLPCSQQQQAREISLEEENIWASQGLGPGGAQVVPAAGGESKV